MSIWRGGLRIAAFFRNLLRLDRPKVWIGTVTTNASGVWTVDYTAAGFTSAPQVFPNATAAGLTAASMVNVKTATKTNTGATGNAVVPAVSVLGLITVTLAGAGVSVDVVAVGD